MFGLGYKPNISNAESWLRNEFGFDLTDLPEPRSVLELFDSMSKEGRLSPDAQVALLYRLVAMNFLFLLKLMKDEGKDVTGDMLMAMVAVSDKSVDWSRRAADHVTLEKLTSPLNCTITNYLDLLGVERGD